MIQSRNGRDLHQDMEALVDGELPHDKAKNLLEKIKNDSNLKSRYESLMRQKALLRGWWFDHRKHY